MTLERAIALGLENNFDIRVSASNIRIAENNNTWARAGRYPTVDLNGTFSNSFTNDNNPASFLQGTFYIGNLGASLDAQWVVFNGGRVQFSKDLLDNVVSQRTLEQLSTSHDLLRDICRQYTVVLFQQERLEVLKETLDLSRDQLAYEETRKDFGVSNTYNLLQFESAVISDSINVVNQILAIDIAQRDLYNILDMDGRQDFTFPDRLSTEIEAIDEDQLKAIMSEDNYTLRTLEMVAAIDQVNRAIEESALRPVVSLFASAGLSQNAFRFFADNPTTGEPFKTQLSNRLNGSFGVNVNWNLYDGGVRRANVENARIQEDISYLGIVQARAELNNQLDILISNYKSQVGLLTLADDRVNVARKNLDISGERFKAGQITSLDFRNVQVQYLNAAFNKVNAIYNLIQSKIDMDYLVGRFAIRG